MLYAYIVVVYFAFDKVFIKEFCYYCRRSWRIVTCFALEAYLLTYLLKSCIQRLKVDSESR